MEAITEQTQNPWNSEQAFSYDGMWISTEECIKHIQRKISGDENTHWFPYIMRRYLAPALGWEEATKPRENYRCLILGSNEGYMERLLCENGFIGEIIASDIADKAITRARQKIEELGYTNVTHIVADLNKDYFEGTFDFIIAEGVLHHIENIEVCLQHLQSSLTDEGLLMAVEHFAPFRFQLPEVQVRWINAALSVLPKELRPFPPTEPGYLPATPHDNLQVYYVTPSEESVASFDPSEAISGYKMKALLPQFFKIIEQKGYGGTILSYMTGHFDFKRANHDEFALHWLKILIQIEETLIETGILEDEFKFYVLQKPSQEVV